VQAWTFFRLPAYAWQDEVMTMKAMIASTTLVAALFTGPAVAQQQQQTTGTAQYCLKGATGPIKCEFHNRADCEAAKPSNSSDQCVLRSEQQGTVGGRSAAPEPPPGMPGNQKD
jgi:hypothetical protein